VRKGSKVAVVFPDKIKGGFQADSHRKVSIPIILEECLQAGVDKRDITLICSNGLHSKNTREEIKSILGDQVFNDYWWSGQIVNHDSEDWDNLVGLGKDGMGSPVIMNKTVFDADLAVLFVFAIHRQILREERFLSEYYSVNY
jgi:nickel-dependent lactate racemase